MTTTPVVLPLPPRWSRTTRGTFLEFAQALSVAPTGNGAYPELPDPPATRSPAVTAAAHVLRDLVSQGWAISVDNQATVSATPPDTERDPASEKERVRRQELLKRDEQLSSPSVHRFVTEMEEAREFNGRFVSIFSLMRDGAELAAALQTAQESASTDPDAWHGVIDPYVQVISSGDRCSHTGLRLTDVWRYFRHTWTNQYVSTPGRTMLILVRDRAAPFHPVIGIAALGSSIVQISERDRWIGWHPEQHLTSLAGAPTLRAARWIVRRLEQGKQEIYVDDLVRDGLFWPSLWRKPSVEAITRLEDEAAICRARHHRFVRRSDFKGRPGDIDWQKRAESDLFRSKRCLALVNLLRARLALTPFLYPTATSKGLRKALADAEARRAIQAILRKAKADAVGTEIADLTVCGAVAPYSELLGGKLVSMLAVSPAVVRAYHERYRGYASEIASSIAGRPVRRPSNLVFVGTTSLYGSGSSQYNRVHIPKDVLGGRADVRFHDIGRSKSFGTSHLSNASVAALLRLSEQSRNGIRVNSIFGEGVNPKLRKVRDGIDRLGWPSNDLLQHRRQRIVYGVPLISNLLPYLLGIDREPKYVFRTTIRDDAQKITGWWIRRWLAKRAIATDVLERVSTHTTARPVRHGARVRLPSQSADGDG
jgi:hypothetical protein